MIINVFVGLNKLIVNNFLIKFVNGWYFCMILRLLVFVIYILGINFIISMMD